MANQRPNRRRHFPPSRRGANLGASCPPGRISAFRTLLGGSDMMAYLAMMAPRLVELRRVLKETESI